LLIGSSSLGVGVSRWPLGEGAAAGNAGKEGPLQQFIVRGPFPVLVAALALGSAAPASAAAPEDIARAHVGAHAGTFGVQAADVTELSTPPMRSRPQRAPSGSTLPPGCG
jgi:hypothetical protein